MGLLMHLYIGGSFENRSVDHYRIERNQDKRISYAGLECSLYNNRHSNTGTGITKWRIVFRDHVFLKSPKQTEQVQICSVCCFLQYYIMDHYYRFYMCLNANYSVIANRVSEDCIFQNEHCISKIEDCISQVEDCKSERRIA